MNQTTAARVAAFVDGEGCMTRKKWRRKDETLVVIPVLQVVNTALERPLQRDRRERVRRRGRRGPVARVRLARAGPGPGVRPRGSLRR